MKATRYTQKYKSNRLIIIVKNISNTDTQTDS